MGELVRQYCNESESKLENTKYEITNNIALTAEHADKYVVAWKRGIAILTAGRVNVTPDTRVQLVQHGYSLRIHNATQQDAGAYSCQIATMTPTEITHTVDILSKCPPAVPNVLL